MPLSRSSRELRFRGVAVNVRSVGVAGGIAKVDFASGLLHDGPARAHG